MPAKSPNDPDGAAAYHHAEFLKFFLKIFFKFFSIHEAYILIRYSRRTFLLSHTLSESYGLLLG